MYKRLKASVGKLLTIQYRHGSYSGGVSELRGKLVACDDDVMVLEDVDDVAWHLDPLLVVTFGVLGDGDFGLDDDDLE
jgi:hypothetical protein